MTWCAFAVHVECLRGDGGAAEQDNANKEVPSRRWGTRRWQNMIMQTCECLYGDGVPEGGKAC